ncbi:MAG: hypothetical protein WBJ36_04450, partial [Tenuifilum sp.]|uniref:hypothetical protein n=1 Tax=Tenuifilum sp. TaxID=2760880 RepID=UPI001B70399C|nr:hypothetical protein [Bacteroidales bacterium]
LSYYLTTRSARFPARGVPLRLDCLLLLLLLFLNRYHRVKELLSYIDPHPSGTASRRLALPLSLPAPPSRAAKVVTFSVPRKGLTQNFFLPPSAPPRALPSESGCKSRKAFLITQEDYQKKQDFFKKSYILLTINVNLYKKN